MRLILMRRTVWCACIGGIIAGGDRESLYAAVPLTQRGVDLVAVREGPTYFGAVVSPRNAAVVRIAVQREWFQKAHPERYAEFLKMEQEQQKRLGSRLTTRIEKWIADRRQDETLVGFLESELARLKKKSDQAGNAAAGSLSQFVFVNVPQDDVRRVFRQPRTRRQWALLAWRERLSDVENLSTDDLAKQLRKRNVAPVAGPVDLSDRLPKISLTDAQWAARVAIVEYQYRRQLDFQGMGGTLIQTDGDAAAMDLKGLVEQLVPGQLDLAELLGGAAAGGRRKSRANDGLNKASQTAGELGCRGFRVTRIGQDVLGGRARVTSQFVARMPDGKWRVVWTQSVSVSSNQVKDDQLKQVEQDPRVKQISSLAKTLGLGGDQLQTALRFGAATMQAQQEVDGRFFEFRDRYISRLDEPTSH